MKQTFLALAVAAAALAAALLLITATDATDRAPDDVALPPPPTESRAVAREDAAATSEMVASRKALTSEGTLTFSGDLTVRGIFLNRDLLPIAGARIWLVGGPSESQFVRETKSDDFGKFTFENVQSMKVWLDGLTPYDDLADHPVAADNGASPDGAVLISTGDARKRTLIQLTYPNGSPVSNATVLVRTDGRTVRVQSGRAGYFSYGVGDYANFRAYDPLLKYQPIQLENVETGTKNIKMQFSNLAPAVNVIAHFPENVRPSDFDITLRWSDPDFGSVPVRVDRPATPFDTKNKTLQKEAPLPDGYCELECRLSNTFIPEKLLFDVSTARPKTVHIYFEEPQIFQFKILYHGEPAVGAFVDILDKSARSAEDTKKLCIQYSDMTNKDGIVQGTAIAPFEMKVSVEYNFRTTKAGCYLYNPKETFSPAVIRIPDQGTLQYSLRDAEGRLLPGRRIQISPADAPMGSAQKYLTTNNDGQLTTTLEPGDYLIYAYSNASSSFPTYGSELSIGSQPMRLTIKENETTVVDQVLNQGNKLILDEK